MGKLTYLILHCTDTPADFPVSPELIRRWHTSPPPRGRGWDRVGYSDLVHQDGTIENITPYDEDNWVDNDEMTWGCAGVNSISRHVVYVGGCSEPSVPKDTLTDEQFVALENLFKEAIARHPDILIAGHNQFNKRKACPSFEVVDKFRLMGIPEKNIYLSNG